MNKLLYFFSFLVLFACADAQEASHIQKFDISTEAGFRGISAVSDDICWFSGAEGQVYRVEAASNQVFNCSPAGFNESDFRDIHAFSASKAIILSAGLPAVMLLTEDGGESWQEVYRNEAEGIFFDALDFWDDQRGLAFSDAIGQALPIIETKDGGKTWTAIDPALIPPSHLNQGGFAASGTSLKTYGKGQAIIGLGGKESTIFLTQDYGKSWHRAFTPIDQGTDSKGIFSFSFIDEKRILVAGGDYKGDSLSDECISISENGGYSWKVSQESRISLAGKYISNIIAIDEKQWLAHSRFGAYFTEDAGRSWQSFPFTYYSGSLAENYIWLSGPKGDLARVAVADLKKKSL
tara:strand:- start:79748 stop:80797 length:1050 start_codon:yes stop_codon:yes gene_type:complete